MIEAYKCPSCGSGDYWQDPKDHSLCRCKFCETTWRQTDTNAQPTLQKEELPEPVAPTMVTNNPPSNQSQEENSQAIEPTTTSNPHSVIEALFSCLLIVGVLGGLSLLMYFMLRNDVQDGKRQAEITEIGEYQIPYLDCGTDKVVVEYGFKYEEPLMAFYPQIEGKNRWEISDETLQFILSEKAKPRADQLWIHCNTFDNEPGFFASWFPTPENGVKIVMKKTDK